VAGDATQHKGFVGRHGAEDFVQQGFHHGHEGVSVVIAERRKPMAFEAQVQQFRQRDFATAMFFPELAGRFIAVGGRLVERAFVLAKRGVDGDHGFPGDILEPLPRQTFHGRRELLVLLEIGLDALQGADAFALQVTLASAGKHRFSDETMLHPNAIAHGVLQKLRFRVRHAANMPETGLKFNRLLGWELATLEPLRHFWLYYDVFGERSRQAL